MAYQHKPCHGAQTKSLKIKSSQSQYHVGISTGLQALHRLVTGLTGLLQKQKFTNSVPRVELRWRSIQTLSMGTKEVSRNDSSQTHCRVWPPLASIQAKHLPVIEHTGLLQKRKFTNSMLRMELRWHMSTNHFVDERKESL